MVDDVQLGRSVRALRHRRGWTQQELATNAGIRRGAVSMLENGFARGLRVEIVQRVLLACGARLRWDVGWRGPELQRLLDAGHARLQNAVKAGLERAGWQAVPEASFNHYGERGRIDILAFHPRLGILLVVEIKTAVADIQGLLGPLDVKVRVARQVGAERGWRARSVVPCLVVSESATARRRIAAHAALFSRFSVRGREASKWLGAPAGAPSGLLVFRFQSNGRGTDVRRAGRQRVRRTCAQLRAGAHPIST